MADVDLNWPPKESKHDAGLPLKNIKVTASVMRQIASRVVLKEWAAIRLGCSTFLSIGL